MEWISVNDRLPKHAKGRKEVGVISENVIACTVEKEVCTGWVENGGGQWFLLTGDSDYHKEYEMDYVTHWMPLPPAPKEDA